MAAVGRSREGKKSRRWRGGSSKGTAEVELRFGREVSKVRRRARAWGKGVWGTERKEGE